ESGSTLDKRGVVVMKHKTKPGREVATTQQFQELRVPYYFSDIARLRQENIEVGDFVQVRGLEKKYKLIDIYPQFGSVRVRAVGDIEGYVFPWTCIRPCKTKDETSK